MTAFFGDRLFVVPFTENKAILLVLEDITVHDVKIVLENPRQLRSVKESPNPRADLEVADSIKSWRASKSQPLRPA